MTRDLIAIALAEADSEEQGAFFNAFFREVYAMCRGNKHRGEEQVTFIARFLDGTARTAIKEFAGCVDWEIEQDQERRSAECVSRQQLHKLQEEVRQLETRKRQLEEDMGEAK